MAKEVEKGAQSDENQRKLAEFLANMALLKKQSIKASMELREFLHSIISGIILVLLIMHNKKHQSLHLGAALF